NSFNKSTLSPLLDAATQQPLAFANSIAKLPTPPAAAWTKTRSSYFISPKLIKHVYAVSPTNGIEAASSNVSTFGFLATIVSFTTTCSAYVPFRVISGLEYTSSPTSNFVTLSPTILTTPAASHPSINGNS